jgi:Flp pilus assembly protein TadG
MLYLPKLKINPLRRLREQKGQSIIIFTFAVLGLIAMLGLALDLGLVYIERVRVNRTTDAATLASVVELPYEQDAIERAIEYIQLNGYDVGGDTEILVRGCVDLDRTTPFSVTNVAEANLDPITSTNMVTGMLYIPAAEQPPRATFLIDTGSYQANDSNIGNCNAAGNLYGTATKIQVRGRSNVDMNFMQFFGFGTVPVQDEAIAENITNLDVMIVFDVSGSMEYETNCYDCWVRETYDVINRPYPQNGYYNPLPYNPAWAGAGVPQSIPLSNLCTVFPPNPYRYDNGTPGNPNDDLFYLVHEAELYSRNKGDWRFEARKPGYGFWVIQRGSRRWGNTIQEVGGGTNDEKDFQGNQAVSMANQSSNVCNPPAGGIDCNVGTGGASICASVDCSAYIMAHPYPTYSQSTLSQAGLQGGAYDSNCFSGGVLSKNCWNNPAAPQDVPFVEYDFTPTWSGNTYIWLRARGAGGNAYKWTGNPPTALNAWRTAVYWQVDSGNVNENTTVAASGNGWRDNRATSGEWQWIRLGSVNTGSVLTQTHTLRIYQGSAGYKIDKIVFTNDSRSSTPGAMLLDSNGASDIGPRASDGSATREACNPCNPAFGYEIDSTDCICKLNANDNANGGRGSGSGCSSVLTTTNRLEDELYSGIQPIRGAQEAVKRFVLRLQPQFDQVGFVAFTTDVIDNEGVNKVSRSKLQCLRWATLHDPNGNGVQGCYDSSVGTPISYTHVLKAIERQWPVQSTDIAEGLKEGLVELGIPGHATDSNCTDNVADPAGTDDDGHACDRGGAARRVIILLTDGMPNMNPGSCAPTVGSGRPDLWDGLIGPNDDNFECAMYYAWVAAENNVTVYTIGLGAGANPDLLTAIATGVDPRGGVLNDGNDYTYFNGRGGMYQNASTPDDLDQIFSNILSNIYVRIVG